MRVWWLWLAVAGALEPRRRAHMSVPRGGATSKKVKIVDPRGTPPLEVAARPFVALAKKYDKAVEANPKLELYVQIGGTLVFLQLVHRYVSKHGKEQRVVLFARLAYLILLALQQWALVAVQARVEALDDTTPLTIPANPMLEALAKRAASSSQDGSSFGALGEALAAKETTVRDYDLDMVRKGRHAETGSIAVMAYLHLRRGYLQPLVASTVMGFAALLKNPLLQIHLFGREPEGHLARPFQPPVPAWLKMLQSEMGGEKEVVVSDEAEEDDEEAEDDDEEEDGEEEDDDDAGDEEDEEDDYDDEEE